MGLIVTKYQTLVWGFLRKSRNSSKNVTLVPILEKLLEDDSLSTLWKYLHLQQDTHWTSLSKSIRT